LEWHEGAFSGWVHSNDSVENTKLSKECVMGVMQIMSAKHGHKNEVWDPNIQVEVDSAEDTFNDLRAKGYIAFKVDRAGEKAEIMSSFDPEAGKMIMSPAQAGG